MNEDDANEHKTRPRPAISRGAPSLLSETPCETKNDESHGNENEIRPRSATSREQSSPLNETPIGIEYKNDVTKDLESTEMASNAGADITVLGISENETNEEKSSPRGGKYNLRPNPNPNFTDEYRY